jgi:tRNA(Arg) A34 adenosine deaminase TadA
VWIGSVAVVDTDRNMIEGEHHRLEKACSRYWHVEVRVGRLGNRKTC